MEDTGAKWGSVCSPVHLIFGRTVGVNVGGRNGGQDIEAWIVESRFLEMQWIAFHHQPIQMKMAFEIIQAFLELLWWWDISRGKWTDVRKPEEQTDFWFVCWSANMDPTALPRRGFEVDVDLGFALFFFFLLCFFLLVAIVRCAQMVLDPYSAISVTTHQEEDQADDWQTYKLYSKGSLLSKRSVVI